MSTQITDSHAQHKAHELFQMAKKYIVPAYTRPASTGLNTLASKLDVYWAYQNSPSCWEKMTLMQIIREGSAEDLTNVIMTSPNPRDIINYRDPAGITALQMAARFNKPWAVELLLSNGAECDPVSESSFTPLSTACRLQHVQIIHILLRYGADPLLDLPIEGNVLHTIAMYSTVQIAEIVFRDIAPPVHSVSTLRLTPLHNAALSGNAGMVVWLLQHGANPRARCSRLTSPLLLASKEGHCTIIQILCLADEQSRGLRKLKILEDPDDDGMTPLHYAVQYNRLQAVQELLQWGADPNICDINLTTPLHICAVEGLSDLVPLLIKFKADPDKQDLEGKTPLHRAVEHQKTDVITALLNEGADIDRQDYSKQSPLNLACAKGYQEVVRLLIKFDADLTKKNFYGQSFVHVSALEGQLDILELLLEHCDETMHCKLDIFDQTALHLAARQKDPRFVSALLTRGYSPDDRDIMGQIPLHIAARFSSHDTVRRLAEVTHNVDTLNKENKTALFLACESGNRDALSGLIDHGPNVRATDKQTRTTLIAAAAGGFTDIVLDLIALRVPVNYRDMDRNTALHHACVNGHLDTIKVLLEHKASVTMTNQDGKSPLAVAVEIGLTDVAVFMMEHISWEDSLSVRDNKGYTCMDLMIAKTPAAVKIVLDKCVTRSEHATKSPDYTIEFNYKYIDPGPKDPMSSPLIYNALSTMLTHDREDLLCHPLCQSNLANKWRNYGRFIFCVDFCIQFGVALMLVVYIYVMPKPNQPEYACRGQDGNGSLDLNDSYSANSTTGRPAFRHRYMHIIQYVLYGFAATLICKRLMHAISVGWRFAFSSQLLSTALSMVLITFGTMPPGFEPCDMQWRAIAYAGLMFLIMVSFILERFEGVGLYFTMFFEVFRTMVKISFLMVFFLLAMDVPWLVMLNSDGFQENEKSVLSTLAMTIGELNFRDNFIKVDNSPYTLDMYLLFPLFILLMNLSLMNLMIGLAVGDINKVQKKAYLTRLRKQVFYLLELEVSTPMRAVKFHIERAVVKPNQKCHSRWGKMMARFYGTEKIYFMRKKEAMDTVEQTTKQLELDMDRQRSKIEELTKTTSATLELVNRLVNSLNTQQQGNSVSARQEVGHI